MASWSNDDSEDEREVADHTDTSAGQPAAGRADTDTPPGGHLFATSPQWQTFRGALRDAVAASEPTGATAAVAILATEGFEGELGGSSSPLDAADLLESRLGSTRRSGQDVYRLDHATVGIVLSSGGPLDLAGHVNALVGDGMPAFSWGSSLFPNDGHSADDLLSMAVKRLGQMRGLDSTSAEISEASWHRRRIAAGALAVAALVAGTLIPLASSGGPAQIASPPMSFKHPIKASSGFGALPSTSDGGQPVQQATIPAPATPELALAASSASVPSPATTSVGTPSASGESSLSQPAIPSAQVPTAAGAGAAAAGGASSGTPPITTAPTPITTVTPPTTTAPTPTTTVTPPTTTTTTTTTVPGRQGDGGTGRCFLLIFCGR